MNEDENKIDINPLSEATTFANMPADSTIPTSNIGGNIPMNFPPTPTDNVPDISSIPTFDETITPEGETAAPTPTETEGVNITTRIQDLMGKLTGKEPARAEAETEAGLPAFQKDLTDVNAQIQALQKESLAIPMQLQEQFAGRGVTKAGLAPIQASALRKNAIKALGLSAISQTLQGNVALAQSTVDRAISAEFAPIETELAYQKELYNMNKDFLDREDKKRSNTLKLQLDERERLLDEEKTNKKSIYDISISALQAGATPSQVQEILKAETVEEAIVNAGGFLKDEELDLNIQLKKAQIEGIELENAISGIKKQQLEGAINSGNVILDKDQQTAAFKLIDDYESISKDFQKQVGAYNRIVASATDPSAAGDLALIFNYMKLLDPGSVVRESEFANAENSAGVPERIRARYNKVLEGERLSPTTRTDFVDRSDKLYISALEQQKKVDGQFTDRSVKFNVPPNVVIRDLSSFNAVSDAEIKDKLSERQTEMMQGLSPFQRNLLEKEGLI